MDNREIILTRSMDLFSSRGYEAVGVQEISETAGVTKPTLYHYFGSKQGLLKALLSPYYAALDEAVSAACAYSGDLPLTLRRLARAYFDFARLNPKFYRFALALLFAPRQGEAYGVAAALHENQYRRVEELFLHASANHGNMRNRQRINAATFIGMVNTCISLWLNDFVELDDALLERSVHQFEHGIYS
jgi:AcrR family transcriptional regulator